MYDCYRPQKAVNDFVRWSNDLTETAMKEEFYPYLAKELIIPEEYIAEKSGHTRVITNKEKLLFSLYIYMQGSTVDLTIVPLPPKPEPRYEPG